MAKYRLLTVVLEKDVAEEELVPLMAAIGQFRDVFSVTAGQLDLGSELAVSEQARSKMGDRT